MRHLQMEKSKEGRKHLGWAKYNIIQYVKFPMHQMSPPSHTQISPSIYICLWPETTLPPLLSASPRLSCPFPPPPSPRISTLYKAVNSHAQNLAQMKHPVPCSPGCWLEHGRISPRHENIHGALIPSLCPVRSLQRTQITLINETYCKPR